MAEPPSDHSVYPEPEIPARLPLGLTSEAVRAWREDLWRLDGNEAGVRAAREELRVVRDLEAYVTEVQRVHGMLMHDEGASNRAIARAAGVSDSYIARRLNIVRPHRHRRRREP